MTNAVFSGVGGLLVLAFNHTFLTNYLGVSNAYVIPIIGIGLMLFATFVFYVAKQPIPDPASVWIIEILGGAWILGSLAITRFNLFGLLPKSYPLINFIALWVAILVIGQFYYLRKEHASTS